MEQYEGRPIQPVDNGNVTGKHLARNFPNTPRPWRAVLLSLPASLSSPSPLRGGSAREGEPGWGCAEGARYAHDPHP